MLTVRRRKQTYYVDWIRGSARIRGSLGTRNQDAARRLCSRIESAISEGAASLLWNDLQQQLPPDTFSRFSGHIGFKAKPSHTWSQLRTLFETHMRQRVSIGKMSPKTESRYKHSIREFDLFLSLQSITLLEKITRPVVEQYKVWRLERSNQKKQARGGGGLILEAAILHRLFSFAKEHELVEKNPVRLEGRPGENPEHGAEPFAPEQLAALRLHAGNDLLSILLLRWTALRGSDAVGLTWAEINLETKEIGRVTQKRKKPVIIPIHDELFAALENTKIARNPTPSDKVLLNPETGRAMSRPRLYNRMLAVGKRAGVPNAHPHRFRDTLAVDMLLRGATPYDVAKLLGDTMETVEKHYTPFVKELRDRVRSILAKDSEGLEALNTRVKM